MLPNIRAVLRRQVVTQCEIVANRMQIPLRAPENVVVVGTEDDEAETLSRFMRRRERVFTRTRFENSGRVKHDCYLAFTEEKHLESGLHFSWAQTCSSSEVIWLF